MADALWNELFAFWALCISGGSIFLTLVSIYLYRSSRTRRNENNGNKQSTVRLVKNFIFVWVLLSLLVFYIFSIHVGSAIIFAAGNIVVEIVLILYLLKNRKERPEQE